MELTLMVCVIDGCPSPLYLWDDHDRSESTNGCGPCFRDHTTNVIVLFTGMEKGREGVTF
jgi:hypothetical protein